MESVGIYDVKKGVKDMSVFTVPDICLATGTVINVSAWRFLNIVILFCLKFTIVKRQYKISLL